jgi:hypothetical protein
MATEDEARRQVVAEATELLCKLLACTAKLGVPVMVLDVSNKAGAWSGLAILTTRKDVADDLKEYLHQCSGGAAESVDP